MNEPRRGNLRMPRSRGAVSGLLLIGLGLWGALIPFIGPYFHFAFTPDHAWAWSAARGWLEVFPGVAAVVGGLLLAGSRNRASAMLGAWLGTAAGVWFVVGRALAPALGIGAVGQPIGVTDAKRAVVEICYFSGLGALMVFLGGAALARLSVRMARDVQVAPTPAAEVPAPEPAPRAVSPDAETQVRQAGDDEPAASEPEPPRSRGGLFRRKRAGV